VPNTQVRVFGKPETKPDRRMAVALSSAADVDTARERAKQAASCLHINYS
jgi:phosphoribosylglycinamide formyltransferase 2